MTASIIFPVYNKSDLLPTTLPTILSQSFRDFELIAVDDGSTDGSGEYLDNIARTDARIRVIHQKNSGVSCARNTALDHATGEYVVFADADDTVNQDWLDVLVKEAEQSRADIVISGFFSVNSDGKILDTVLPQGENTVTGKEFLNSFSVYQSNHGLPGFGHGKIVRRDLINRYKFRFTPGLKLAEDLDFFVRLYERAESIRFIRFAGYNYLQGAVNSAMFCSAYKVDYLSQIKLWLRIRELLSRNKAYNDQNCRLVEQQLANYSLCALLYNFDSAQVSIKKLKQLSNTVKKYHIADRALKPVRLFYLIGANKLCNLYSRLFKIRMSKRQADVNI